VLYFGLIEFLGKCEREAGDSGEKDQCRHMRKKLTEKYTQNPKKSPKKDILTPSDSYLGQFSPFPPFQYDVPYGKYRPTEL
jgi:hypothetical protein